MRRGHMGWCNDPDGTGPGAACPPYGGRCPPPPPVPGGGGGGRSPPPHMAGKARHMGWCSDPDGTGAGAARPPYGGLSPPHGVADPPQTPGGQAELAEGGVLLVLYVKARRIYLSIYLCIYVFMDESYLLLNGLTDLHQILCERPL